jgi:hypothetical protein
VKERAMQASVLGFIPRDASTRPRSAAIARRLALVIACGTAIVVVAALGDPSALVARDPELALLLRGMATIKGVLALVAIAIVAWRLGQPLAPSHAIAYVAGCAVIAASTVAIWQLSFIVPAAASFHAAGLMLLFLAWRDDGGPLYALAGRRRP